MASFFVAPVAHIACVLVFSAATAGAGSVPEPPPLWKLVAESHAIIVGIPNVPVDQLEEAHRSGDRRYIDFDNRVLECLKSDLCPDTMPVRYYTLGQPDSAMDQALLCANGKESVLFLLTGLSSSVGGSANYFAGSTHTALQPSNPDLIREIRAEIAAQQEILRRFAENFPASEDPLHAKVKPLVEATLSRWRWLQKRAFAKLERLGEPAVPAMIMLMDDRRKLPIKDISLRNPPGSFEPFRHYGPEVVADALAAILNQITGEDFGSIHNGASEHRRRAAIDGWRVYLHRTRFGEKNPPLPAP